jgi:hypothetical protein
MESFDCGSFGYACKKSLLIVCNLTMPYCRALTLHCKHDSVWGIFKGQDICGISHTYASSKA